MRPAGTRPGVAVVVSTVLAAASAVWAEGPPAGGRFALVIGVGEYGPDEFRSLPGVAADTSGLAAALRAAGWRVVLLASAEGAGREAAAPSGDNIRREVRALFADRSEVDSVLLVFCGHALQHRGGVDAYLCPADARASVRKSQIPLSEVHAAAAACKAGLRLLVLDVGREDPLAGRAKKGRVVTLSPTLKLKAPPAGVSVLSTCSPGERSWCSAASGRGVFLRALTRGLQGRADADGDRSVTAREWIEYAIRRTSEDVKDELGALQTPQSAGKAAGGTVLAACRQEPRRPDPAEALPAEVRRLVAHDPGPKPDARKAHAEKLRAAAGDKATAAAGPAAVRRVYAALVATGYFTAADLTRLQEVQTRLEAAGGDFDPDDEAAGMAFRLRREARVHTDGDRWKDARRSYAALISAGVFTAADVAQFRDVQQKFEKASGGKTIFDF